MLDPASLGVLIPIIAVSIPVVVLLTKHQQRMAEIIHSSQLGVPSAEINALRVEVRELRDLINQQTIAISSISDRRSTEPLRNIMERVEERVL